METTDFEIIFEDEHFIAINKPCGILVHRTKISEDRIFVLQLLRDQIGQRIYPVHRLDRATSGVLIFGKNSEAAEKLAIQFREKTVEKKYLAIVRGFLEEVGIVDYPLAPEPHKPTQEAVTNFKRIAQTEKDWSVGRYPKSRYSYLEIIPETGRRHQIRRHFSHLRHPIIGDKRHGDVKHNKYFEQELDIHGLLLHAQELRFYHFEKEAFIEIEANLNEEFKKAKRILEF